MDNRMDENTGAPSEPVSEDRPDGMPMPEEKDENRFDLTRELYDWAQALVFSIVFIVILFTFFIRIIGVEGASMEPTLYNNDKIVVTNMFYTPKQGDIIVLRKKSFMYEPIVKRVIATEGQTVDINFDTHEVRVDGVLLKEPYIKSPIARRGDMEFPAVVPEGFVFVLGDNRNNSADSRFASVGMIDGRYILGHVIYRVFPFDSIGKVR